MMPAAYLRWPPSPQTKADRAQGLKDAKWAESLAARAALLGHQLLKLADGQLLLIQPDGKARDPVTRRQALVELSLPEENRTERSLKVSFTKPRRPDQP